MSNCAYSYSFSSVLYILLINYVIKATKSKRRSHSRVVVSDNNSLKLTEALMSLSKINQKLLQSLTELCRFGLVSQFYRISVSLRELVIKLLIMNIKKESRIALDNLFTFGEQQISSCLAEVNKSRFPFCSNLKVRKNPLLHKLVSQQRQKKHMNEENTNHLNLQLSIKYRGRAMSQENRKQKFQFDEQEKNHQFLRNKSNESKHRKKSSLPKVLKRVFPDLIQNTLVQRKVSTAEPSTRYTMEGSVELRPVQVQNSQPLFRNFRPKSVMFLSNEYYQLPEQKIKTIQHQRSRLYSKAFKSKQEQRGKIMPINSKIIENINELKKIYC